MVEGDDQLVIVEINPVHKGINEPLPVRLLAHIQNPEFVQEMQFDRLGCFAYSQEDGTKAAEFPDQVDEDVRAHRADIIMEQQAQISLQYNEKQLDTVKTAVVEGFDKWAECYFGRTAQDAPDIDGKVFFSSEQPLNIGDFVKIRITDVLDYDLLGEVCE